MPAVVADTGPLHYLILIERIDILPALFKTVFMPETVRIELSQPGTPPPVRNWIAAAPTWLVVRPDASGWDVGLQKLDDGERQAIMLALSLDADLILMDERAGVAIARSNGFVVTGTLGALELAATRGLLDLADAFERLRRTTFHCRPELLQAILDQHRGRS